MTRSIYLLTLAAFAGCSSFAIEESGGTQVPERRIFEKAAVGKGATDSDGSLLVLRDTGFLGGGCNHTFYLDSRKVFEIGVNERIEIHAPAGRHLLRIEDATLLCPGTTTSVETVLEAGRQQVYRIQLTGAQAVNLARFEPAP